jgi:Flp pilus assembly protein CpaB
LKRTNRLVLLIGIFLALVAFVLILVTLQGNKTTGVPIAPTTVTVVIAARDVALGAKFTQNTVTTEERPIDQKPVNGYSVPSDVVGQTARQAVTKGQLITTDIINGAAGSVSAITVPAGKLGMTVQVDQVSGVGTLARTGDHVDLLVALTGDKFPLVNINPVDKSVTVVAGINSTSVKLLLQGLQVIGTMLPPPSGQPGADGTGPTYLNGQQQIVVLAVDAQQAEIIKFAQMDGSISLVLRSADDFRDPVTGEPLDPALIEPAKTTGVTLRNLVDTNGILLPQLVEAIIPGQAPKP